MALVNYAASLQGVALRLTRLDEFGNALAGLNNCYVTKAFMRVSFTPEYEEGDETTEKNAAGEVCVTYKAPDTLKRATMEIAICEPDPEITELLAGGVLLNMPSDFTDPAIAGATVGYASVRVGEAGNTNGVSVEVWSLAIRDGGRDNVMPYFRWIFPKVNLRPSGDRVLENGLLANTFEGWSVGNLNFGTGPMDDWPWPDATDRPFLYARDVQTPWAGANGWQDNTGIVADIGAPRFLPDGSENPEYDIENESDITVPDSYEAELDLLNTGAGGGATGLAAPSAGSRTASTPSPTKPVSGPVKPPTTPTTPPESSSSS